jgi:hypothetical protein
LRIGGGSGIAGQNWFVELVGPPSADEERAGYTVHGEASIAQRRASAGETAALSQLMTVEKSDSIL